MIELLRRRIRKYNLTLVSLEKVNQGHSADALKIQGALIASGEILKEFIQEQRKGEMFSQKEECSV